MRRNFPVSPCLLFEIWLQGTPLKNGLKSPNSLFSTGNWMTYDQRVQDPQPFFINAIAQQNSRQNHKTIPIVSTLYTSNSPIIESRVVYRLFNRLTTCSGVHLLAKVVKDTTSKDLQLNFRSWRSMNPNLRRKQWQSQTSPDLLPDLASVFPPLA